MTKRERAEYMREYRSRRRRQAAADAGGVPAVPERFAATLRFLASPRVAEELDMAATAEVALMTLAKDCGYTLERLSLTPCPSRVSPARGIAGASPGGRQHPSPPG